ncbi:hypothetical protein BGZ46_005150, partial [Entomortierella lignicola]
MQTDDLQDLTPTSPTNYTSADIAACSSSNNYYISYSNSISSDPTNNCDHLESSFLSKSTDRLPNASPSSLDQSITASNVHLPKSEDKCTYEICVKNLIEKHSKLTQQTTQQTNDGASEQEQRIKRERDHILRYHPTTPVRLRSLAPGLTVEYSRSPDVGMKSQCYCGKTLLPRSSVSRHYDKCEPAQLMSIYPHLKCRSFAVFDSSRVQADLHHDESDESGGETEDTRQNSAEISSDSLIKALEHQKTESHNM